MLTEEQNLILGQLEKAAQSGDAEEADQALLSTFSEFEKNKEFRVQTIPSLIKILAHLNHYSHEDIVRLLQQAQDSRAVDVLYNATLVIPEYQRYDEGAALIRKCTWALADIGNAEAYRKLILIAASSNTEIAGYAQRRIDLWGKELPRKAYQFKP